MDASCRPLVTELDLMAYADGLIPFDEPRRATVERFLDGHPDEAARVADFRMQNEALQRWGEAWLNDPVPEHLLELVGRRQRAKKQGGAMRWQQLSSRRVAMSMAILIAAAAGWTGSQWLPPSDRLGGITQPSFSRQSVASVPQASAPMVTGVRPLTWLVDHVSVQIEAPRLDAFGYELVAEERVMLDDMRAIRLGYQSQGGRTLEVYLRPRWETRKLGSRQRHRKGAAMVHWAVGPLAVAMTGSDVSEEEAGALVQAVRRAILSPAAPLEQPPDRLRQGLRANVGDL